MLMIKPVCAHHLRKSGHTARGDYHAAINQESPRERAAYR